MYMLLFLVIIALIIGYVVSLYDTIGYKETRNDGTTKEFYLNR